jgi:hypothetical protein
VISFIGLDLDFRSLGDIGAPFLKPLVTLCSDMELATLAVFQRKEAALKCSDGER